MYRSYMNIINTDLKSRFQLKRSADFKMKYKKKMESEFVTIDNIPIRVDSWGGYLPSKILDKTQEKPNELILMIPGNPGVTKFYEKFLSSLHERTKKPIWIVSHGGHDKTNKSLPSLRNNKHLYSLKGQVEQKNKFIATYLQNVKLHCIGHSIGCKMLLEVLKKEEKSVDIERCIMLFPALERLDKTPNGAYVIFVLKYILWLTLFGSYLFVWLPKFLQIILLRIYCLAANIPIDNMPAMWRLVDPYVLSKVFYLADDEMKTVKELDDEALTVYEKKLKLYYGANDGWTPLKFVHEMKLKHKDIDIEICSRGYQHTFVLKESLEMAKLVSNWFK